MVEMAFMDYTSVRWLCETVAPFLLFIPFSQQTGTELECSSSPKIEYPGAHKRAFQNLKRETSLLHTTLLHKLCIYAQEIAEWDFKFH